MNLSQNGKWIAITLVLALFAGCAATEEGDPPDPNYDVLMDSAKAALEKGDGYQAYILCTEADRLRPLDPKANLGIMLSDLLQLLNLVDQVIYFGGEMAQTAPGDEQQLAVPKQWDDVEIGAGDQIDVLLMQIFDERLEEMVVTGEAAKSDPDILFPVSSIPLDFQGESILNLPGNWDRSDVLLFLAFSRIIQSTIDILLSIDLNFDFGLVMDMASTDFSVLDTTQVIDLVVGTFYTMLTDEENANFLLTNDEAEARMAKSGINLGMAAEEIVLAFKYLYDPAGPLGYVEIIDNGTHDPSESYFLGDLDPMDAQMMAVMPEILDVVDQVRIALWDGTELDVDPESPNYFDLSSLNVVLEGLGIPGIVSIPSYPVDLGGLFTDPSPEEFKETVTSLLGCLNDSAALIPTVTCVIESL